MLSYETRQMVLFWGVILLVLLQVIVVVRQHQMMKRNEGYEYRGGISGSNNMYSS